MKEKRRLAIRRAIGSDDPGCISGLNQKTLHWQIDGCGAHELIHEFIDEIKAA